MSNPLNITKAAFGGLREVTTAPLWQYDYGQILKITGLDLPQAFEVHFSNSRKSGETVTQIGSDEQVTIPDMYLTSGADIYAFVFLHDGTDDGETEYVVKIPVRERPEPSDIEPTPEQQDVITEAIAALNDAVEQTGEDKAATAALAEAAAASSLVATEAAQSAQGSATAASTSATTASNAAATATTKASEAATSAANAASAKTAAETAETNAKAAQTASESARASAESAAQTATTKASEASASATSASGSASAASASASAASGSATNAANSATAASGSATSAATSATTASTKASEASASATAANTAKAAAQTAQTAAEAAQTAAETAASTFETDTTLTVSGKAADAKAAGDEISDLKSALGYIGYDISLYEKAGNTGSIKYSDGTDNTSSSYSDCKSTDKIAVLSGWILSYKGRNATGNCLIAFYDTNGAYVASSSVEGAGAIVTGIYTVPANGFIRVAFRSDISTHTFVLTANGALQGLQADTTANTQDISDLQFKQSELYPTAQMFTGKDFVIGTHINPAGTNRIRLSENHISKTGSIYIIVPATNTYGYEVECMNGNTRVGPSVNAWTYTNGIFKVVYARVRYDAYNIYMRKSDNSDWTSTDIDKVQMIIVDGGKTDAPVALNIMSHNVGHYNYGVTGGYSGSDYANKVTEWREMLAKNKPDVILIQEYNSPDGRFDSGNNVNAQTALYSPIFRGFYTNALGGAGVGTLVTKMALQATWDITVTAGDTRKFACGVISIGDVPVVLCSLHLIPGTDATAVANRESQRDQVISALANFDRVIIAGDFNANNDSFYSPFVDAGYTLCNHGYFGSIETQADGAIDNIILKGLLPYDCTTNADDAVTSDHYPLMSQVRVV